MLGRGVAVRPIGLLLWLAGLSGVAAGLAALVPAPAGATVSPPARISITTAASRRIGVPLPVDVRVLVARETEARVGLLAGTDWLPVAGRSSWSGRLQPARPEIISFEVIPTVESPGPVAVELELPGWTTTRVAVPVETERSEGREDPALISNNDGDTATRNLPSHPGPTLDGSTLGGPTLGEPTMGVRGRAVFADDRGQWIGIRGAQVRLWSQDPTPACEPAAADRDQPLGQARTDADGYFRIDGPVASIVGDGRRLRLEICATSEAASVQAPAGQDGVYCFEADAGAVADTDSDLDLGAVSPSGGRVSGGPGGAPSADGAWQLFNAATEARDTMAAVLGDVAGGGIPPVLILWPSTEPSTYRPPAGLDSGSVLINQEDTWRSRVFFHEYAHHLFFHFAEIPGLDYVNDQCDAPSPGRCAWLPEVEPIPWIEGWADHSADLLMRILGKADPVEAANVAEGPADACCAVESQKPGRLPRADQLEGVAAAALWRESAQIVTTGPDGLRFKAEDLARVLRLQWDVVINSDPDPADEHHNHPLNLREYWHGINDRYPDLANDLSGILRDLGVDGLPSADLRADFVRPPSAAHVGGGVEVAEATTNRGDIGVGHPSLTSFFLSREGEEAARSAILVGQRVVPSLRPGESSTEGTLLHIPRGLDPGTYLLRACSDAAGTIPELDEANNCGNAVSLTLEVLPDLAVTAVQDPPPTVAQGGRFPVTETTANLDAATASTSVTRFYLSLDPVSDDQDVLLVGTHLVPSLDPIQSDTATTTLGIPAATPPGQYFLMACADDLHAVRESDEYHNCTASAARVLVLAPDLVTAPANGVHTTRLIPGRTQRMAVLTTNIGRAQAPPTRTAFYLSHGPARGAGDIGLIGGAGAPDLAPGRAARSAARVKVPIGTAPGVYTLLACADDDGIVAETDETNNCSVLVPSVEVFVSDLQVLALDEPPASAPYNQPLLVGFTIGNAGSSTAPASIARFYLSSDSRKGAGDVAIPVSIVVPALPQGGQFVSLAGLPLPLGGGPYHLLMCVDDDARIDEVDETNNCRASTATFEVALPDLSPDAVTYVVDPGSPAQFEASVCARNAGMADAGASTAQVFLRRADATGGDLPLVALSVPPVGAGQTICFTAPVTLPPGTPPGPYVLWSCLDALHAVPELDEGDNCGRASDVLQVPGADLVVQVPSVVPDLLAQGASIVLDSSVLNQGSVAAPVSGLALYVYLPGTGLYRLIGSRAVQSLLAAQADFVGTTISMPYDVPPGSYTVTSCADSQSVVAEIREDNNCLTSTNSMEVRASDLAETGIVLERSSTGPSGAFSVTDTVRNSGQAASPPVGVGFYLSTDGAKSADDRSLGVSRAVPSLGPSQVSTGASTFTLPAGTAPGVYFVIACVDDLNAVAEGDENDNCIASPSVFIGFADLLATDVSVAAGAVAPGGVLQARYTLANIGDVPAETSTTRFYLSLGPAGGAGSLVAAATVQEVPLAPSDSRTSDAQVPIPPTTAPGPYYLLVCANATAGVLDKDATNNCGHSAGPFLVGLPDLVAAPAGGLPATALPGTGFDLGDTTRNDGQVPSVASVTRYYLSLDAQRDRADLLLSGSRAVPALAPAAAGSGTATVTMVSTVPPGAYYVIACADDTGMVPESDETDNCAPSATTIRVRGSDLTETNVSATPASATVGGTLAVSDTAGEQGGVGAGAFQVRFYLSVDQVKDGGDRLLSGARLVAQLGAGQTSAGSTTVTVPAGTVSGAYYVLACADDLGGVPEEDESNNCAASAGQVQIAGADLVTDVVGDPPASAAPGDGFGASDTVRNQGGADAGAFQVRFYLSADRAKDGDDRLLGGARLVSQLGAGLTSAGNTTVTVPATAPAGAFYLLACADDPGAVPEVDEGNNCAASAGQVQIAGVDLVMDRVGDPPASLSPGGSFAVSDTARNRGGAAAGAFQVRFYLSADQVKDGGDQLLAASRAVSLLGAGQTSTGNTTVIVPTPMPAGAFYLVACADDTGAVAETDEANNCIASTSTLKVERPDLAESRVSLAPPGATSGSVLTLTDTVRNQGGSAAGAFQVRFYLSTDSVKDAGDRLLGRTRSVGSLEAGLASTGVSVLAIPTDVAAGIYNVLACADDLDAIVEIDENNNCAASPEQAPLSVDLAATKVSDPPPDLAPGGDFDVSDTVSNQGVAAAGPFQVRYYLSADAVRDAGDRLLGGSRLVPPLNSGLTSPGRATVTIPGDCLPGSYLVLACADDPDTIPESDETDNCAASAKPIQVAFPDLVVASAAGLQSSVSPAGEFEVSDTVRNQGAAAAGGFVLRFYLSADRAKDPGDTALVGSRLVESLGVGLTSAGRTSVATPGSAAPGSYYVIACADDTGTVAESDEANNCTASTTTLDVASTTDLVMASMSDPPARAAPGDSFAVTDTVRNQGTVGAGAFTLRYYLSADRVKGPGDALVGTRSLSSLAAGQSSSGSAVATVPVGLAPGSYYLIGCADDPDSVPETDESNNCASSATAAQVAPPDLIETEVLPASQTATLGGTLRLSDTVRNQGAGDAGASESRFYLSLDRTKGSGDFLLTGARPVPSQSGGQASSGSTSATVPESVPPGAYYLVACADDTAVVPESDEGNNCVAAASTLLVQGADLTEASVSSTPASVTASGTLTVSDTARNQGGAGAGPFQVRFYLSLDQVRDGGDRLLAGARLVSPLGAGQTSAGSTIVTVPATAAAGTFYVLACADDTGAVAESDEANNCAASAGQVQVVGPDLAMAGAGDPPASAPPGGSFALSDTVSNQGGAAAGAFQVRFYLSLDQVRDGGDRLLNGARSVSQLGAGQTSAGSTTVTVPATAPGGTFYVVACADDTGTVAESDEANNCVASAGQVQILSPDLTMDDVGDPPASASPGGSFGVSDTVRNLGGAGTGAFQVRFYMSLDQVKDGGDLLLGGSRSVTQLGAGQTSAGSTTVTVPALAPGGAFHVLACADDTGAIVESNETNNCVASAATVNVDVQLPDLAATNVATGSGNASQGGTLAVSDTVRNQGGAGAGAFQVRFYLSLDQVRDGGDRLLTGARLVSQLGAGQTSAGSTTVTVPATAAAGTFYVVACADDTGAVAESDEANNCVASAGQVQVVSPDLTMAVVGDPPASASPGGFFGVSDTVSNQGGAGAGAFQVRFYLSLDQVKDGADRLLGGARSVSQLGAGQTSAGSTTVTVPATAPPGIYHLLACADDPDAVPEGNEDNNCAASTAQGTVGIGPNLVLSGVGDPPQSASPGGNFEVSDTVRNLGAAGAGAFQVRFYLSANQVKDGEDRLLAGSRSVSQLGPGGTSTGNTSVTLPPAVVLGNYYLIACADDPGAIAESSEDDNCAASAGRIDIAGPDLVIMSLGQPPAGASPGGSFSVTDTVRNQGSSGAGSFQVRYYLSVDQVKGPEDSLLTGSRTVSQLGAGALSSGGAIVTVSPALAPGGYYLIACADDPNSVPETSDDNNCSSSQTVLLVQSADLVEVAVTFSPDRVDRGASLVVSDTVRNDGGVGAGAFKVGFYLSRDQIKDAADLPLAGSRVVPSLGPSAADSGATSVVLPSDVEFGSYYLLGCADVAGSQPEENEGNNCVSSSPSQVEVVGPDLVVSSLSSPPALLAPGGRFEVSDRERNIGDGSAKKASVVLFFLSRDQFRSADDLPLVQSREVPPLGPGGDSFGTTIVEAPLIASPGVAYYLLACADGPGLVSEIDEANNCRTSTGTMTTGLPDLSESQIAILATSVQAGGGFDVEDRVVNSGPGPAGPFATRFYLSRDQRLDSGDVLLFGSHRICPLEPGDSAASCACDACPESLQNGQTLTTFLLVPAEVPPGDAYFVIGCTDDLGQIPESDETDNCLASNQTIQVIGPDLRPIAVDVPSPEVPQGGAFEVDDTVENSGTGAAPVSLSKYYLALDPGSAPDPALLVGARLLPTLGAGGTSRGPASLTVPYTVAPGDYYLLSCADQLHAIPEIDEDNNCAASPGVLRVLGAELAATGVTDPPSTIQPGGTFQVDFAVGNSGAASAPPTVTRFYLSPSGQRDSGTHALDGVVQVPAMLPDARFAFTGTASLPVGLQAGTYYLLACADDDRAVAESDEGDNCSRSPHQVTIPQ